VVDTTQKSTLTRTAGADDDHHLTSLDAEAYPPHSFNVAATESLVHVVDLNDDVTIIFHLLLLPDFQSLPDFGSLDLSKV
jgi:hypothetical protein